VEIETPRLRLRPWRMEDKPALLRHADNPNVSRNLFNMFRSPYTEADADAWLSACLALEEPCVKFAIEIEGEVAGGIGVQSRGDVLAKTAEVGYWLGESHWGCGYMTEALRAIVVYAFETLGYHRLEAGHFGWNPASGRVLEKAGFQLEGCQRERFFKNGEFTDNLIYGLLHDEVA
jgi:ribosomal-protein-alanine N-acetyltransferase